MCSSATVHMLSCLSTGTISSHKIMFIYSNKESSIKLHITSKNCQYNCNQTFDTRPRSAVYSNIPQRADSIIAIISADCALGSTNRNLWEHWASTLLFVPYWRSPSSCMSQTTSCDMTPYRSWYARWDSQPILFICNQIQAFTPNLHSYILCVAVVKVC
jgi:hypothetical protein